MILILKDIYFLVLLTLYSLSKRLLHLSKKFNLFSEFLGLNQILLNAKLLEQVYGKGSRQQSVIWNILIELRNEAIKILGIYFSKNQKIKEDKKIYNFISNIQGVLNLRKIRNFTLEGRIIVFKTMAISKIVCLALLTKIPFQLVKQLEKIQKYFLWNILTRK